LSKLNKFEISKVGKIKRIEIVESRSPLVKKILDMSISLCVGYALSIVLLIIWTFILVHTSINEELSGMSVYFISAISCFISGIIMAVKTRKMGLVNGIMIGFFHIILLYTSRIIYSFDVCITSTFFWVLLIDCLFGAIGGIVGINFFPTRN